MKKIFIKLLFVIILGCGTFVAINAFATVPPEKKYFNDFVPFPYDPCLTLGGPVCYIN